MCDYNTDSRWCLKGKSITVTATNFCPPNFALPNNNGGWCNPPLKLFDIAQPAWEKIGIYRRGIIPIMFQRVPCMKNGGVRFAINGRDYFELVMITNVRGSGSIQSVSIKGSKTGWMVMSRNWGANWMNGVQLYTIIHFGGDIVRSRIGSIVNYVEGSTKVTSLRAHSSYEDFVTLIEDTSKIRCEDWLSTTKDTGSGNGLPTTKAGPLRHNSFYDPEPEYRGYPKANGRGLDPRKFGPLVDVVSYSPDSTRIKLAFCNRRYLSILLLKTAQHFRRISNILVDTSLLHNPYEQVLVKVFLLENMPLQLAPSLGKTTLFLPFPT
ncbi:hypothetical protein GIB67_000585 [Kingdonia uniflora]|uniref:Expansin n=1 Tax=Kingdonia uniflora TaxID=39325 RepID=A0A7J7P2Y6_9MAGN|nr:hypothetical protein GIB67_000585 [Kingdonia uniflora]